ncbi:hypothetical protein [Wielerella bovis]|uniref:hypothetical protein n=1 Tax=Wielerella bovis TaxID=2917790 RepID=UPI002018900D|nr:hypothetical protein [Wielerella bovis]ULJ66626.1 hypothetical protein MIS31_10315 [Wielerella bovis]
MTPKFKFGDRVRLRGGAFAFIFITQQGSNDAAVLCEGEAKAFSLPMQHLELIPHPDTVRLDWLEKNQFELGTHYDDDGLGFIDLRYAVYQPDKQGCRLKLSDEKSYRQAIDTTMKEME